MTRFVLFAALVGAFARDPSCGGADSPSSGPNAPCTRDRDCKDGLACAHGVCVDLAADAGEDADAGDAGEDADAGDAAIVDAGGP